MIQNADLVENVAVFPETMVNSGTFEKAHGKEFSRKVFRRYKDWRFFPKGIEPFNQISVSKLNPNGTEIPGE